MSRALFSPTRRSWLLGLVAVAAAAGLSFSYFTHGDTRKVIADEWRGFYQRIKPGWALLRESEIDYAFTSNPDLWTTLAVRTAYGRWRLRPLAPEAFDNIMRDYENGWWISPPRETWELKFAAYDARWRQERSRFLAAAVRESSRLEMNIQQPGDDILIMRFPGRPFTWQVGTLIRLVADAPLNALPDGPVTVYWETEKAPGLAGHRRRLATWVRLNGAPEGSQRILVELDMSWEPLWMYADSIPAGFHFRSPGIGRWKVVQVPLADNSLFPISEATAAPPKSGEPSN